MFQHETAIASAPNLYERSKAVIWTFQGYGLILLVFLSFFPKWFHSEEYLFFVLLAVAVTTTWFEGRAVWVRTPIDLPLLLLVSWVLFTVPFATDPAYSFTEWRKLVAQLLVFYWTIIVLRAHKNDSGVVRGVLAVVALGSVLMSAFAIVDFIERGGSWKDRYARAAAPSSDYNWLSTYMVIVIPMLIAAANVLRVRWQRIVCGYTSAISVVSLLISYTRAGWLGLIAQAIAYWLFIGRRRLAVVTFVVCVMLGAGFVASSTIGYQRSTLDSWTLTARLSAWEQGLESMARHPIVGVGYGNNTFQPVVATLQMGNQPMGLHNTFLMVGVGSGVPALVLLIWTLFSAGRSLLHEGWKTSDRETLGVLVGIAIMIVGFAVRNFFDYMFAGSLAYLFWILLAIGMHQREKSRKSTILTS